MSIRIAPLPEGTRVKVVRGDLPQDPATTGREGVVVATTEYRANAIGVQLDGESQFRWFHPSEVQITKDVPLVPPERLAAKQIKSLP
ncbi:MAG: hypothetical protein ABIV28_06150 [Longimicrobiales bacterium]